MGKLELKCRYICLLFFCCTLIFATVLFLYPFFLFISYIIPIHMKPYETKEKHLKISSLKQNLIYLKKIFSLYLRLYDLVRSIYFILFYGGTDKGLRKTEVFFFNFKQGKVKCAHKWYCLYKMLIWIVWKWSGKIFLFSSFWKYVFK